MNDHRLRRLLIPFVAVLCSCTFHAVDDSGNVGSQNPGGPPRTVLVPRESARPLTSAVPVDSPCEAFGAGRVTGTVASPQLTEISGLVASRANANLLWVHNDNSGDNRLFGIRGDGTLATTVTVQGADITNWEDIALSAGPGGDELWLADIGDNNTERTSVRLYRVAEPTVDAAAVDDVASLDSFDTVSLRYPDSPHDAEALIVDPTLGQLIIVTKERHGGPAKVFTAALPPGGSDTDITMVAAGEIDFADLDSRLGVSATLPLADLVNLVTAADLSATGDRILIRTYGKLWLWKRTAGSPITEALQRDPCEAPTILEIQGEAVGFDPLSGGYITVAEGVNANIHQFS